MPKILWIEDDYYHVKGLFRRLEKEGYIVINALSANEAYKKVKNWQEYDLIVVDIILPLKDQRMNELLPEVANWIQEEYVGIGLLKYLCKEIHVTIPIVVLSVATNEISDTLDSLGITNVLVKGSLLPQQVQDMVHEVLRGKDGNKK